MDTAAVLTALDAAIWTLVIAVAALVVVAVRDAARDRRAAAGDETDE